MDTISSLIPSPLHYTISSLILLLLRFGLTVVGYGATLLGALSAYGITSLISFLERLLNFKGRRFIMTALHTAVGHQDRTDSPQL
jgi:hypothetical protein